jgi:hypothetical protein
VKRWVDLIPAAPAAWLVLGFVGALLARWSYGFDLEWMEGGMLAHAWRLERGLPLYTPPDPSWIPYVYPPGYSALLAAVPGPVDYGPGRLLSWLGTLGAASGMVHLVWRQGRSLALGLLCAALFVGTYRASGAFLDMVRPDAVAMGLAAWALSLSVDGRRGTAVAGGLLLCAAFTVKHNFAAFGVPLALGLWAWRGWREAMRFGLSAAVPALAFTGYLQWRSGGGFLQYLIEVPRSHPMAPLRGMPGAPGELGHWVGLAIWVGCLGLVAAAPRGFRAVHPAVSWVAATCVGLACAAWAVAQPPVVGAATPHAVVMGLTFFSLGAVAGSALVVALAAAVERRIDGPWLTGFGVLVVAMVLASLMRAHNGGFINVLIPTHWVLIALAGVVLGQVRQAWPGWPAWVGSAVAVAVQGGWLVALSDFDEVRPTDADTEAGGKVVAAIQEHCDGPVLSPYFAWLPVYAGQDPSLHLISLWDVVHKNGPLHVESNSIAKAVHRKRYACVLEAGRQPLAYGVPKNYERVEVFQFPGQAMKTKTGWPVRPRALLVPK